MFILNLLAKPAYAQCPVCVVTVGGGLLLAKKLGIDDLLVSIWLSALNTALAFWFVTRIKKKILNNGYLWTLILFITTLIYVITTKQVGHLRNTFFGIDKIIFGLVAGMVISLGAILLDKFLRSRNNGKVFFPYQKVITPIAFLSLTTLIISLLLKIK